MTVVHSVAMLVFLVRKVMIWIRTYLFHGHSNSWIITFFALGVEPASTLRRTLAAARANDPWKIMVKMQKERIVSYRGFSW